MNDRPQIRIHEFKRVGAVTLSAEEMTATFLPELGMLGASLTHEGREYLDLGAGLDHFRAGHTIGLPFLHPWANRLSDTSYAVDDRLVDVGGLDLPTDPNGLPIHGTLVGAVAWEPVKISTSLAAASFVARLHYDESLGPRFDAFPFPHEVVLEVTVDGSLSVVTTVKPTGDRPVPVSFGFHPWLKLPRSRRSSLRVTLPARQHIGLDGQMIPTGDAELENPETVKLGDRSFDDHYVLGERRRVIVASSSSQVAIDLVDGYPYLQVYAPADRNVVCIEPMTALTDSLVKGTCPWVAPGEAYRAQFTISIR